MDKAAALNYAYHDRGGAACLIWFGGIHEPFLTPNFLPPAWNFLNFLDAKADWYTSGVEGFSESFSDTVDRIAHLLADLPCVCAGQSSGGYAALRFAHALGASLCIAFAPQTKNLKNEDGSQLPPFDLPSVEDIYLEKPPQFPTLIHLSRSENSSKHTGFWNDWWQISQIQNCDNVTVIRHPYDIHAVTIGLAGEGRFQKSIVAGLKTYTTFA